MDKRLLSLYLLLVYLFTWNLAIGRGKNGISASATPLCFIANAGQITDQYGHLRNDIQYKVSTPGMNLFIGNGQLHYQWSKINYSQGKHKFTGELDPIEAQMYRMDVTLVGADQNAVVITENPQEYYEHFLGLAERIAHSVGKITYKNVYPNIDWVLYVKDSSVEYDFIVHPGGRVQDIQLQYGGATALNKTKDKSIKAITPMGVVTELRPYGYEQETNETVATSFEVSDDKVSFNVASYTGTLVIDPALMWGTYYGGTGFDQASATACDTAGNVYFAGYTTSINNIASSGAYQTSINATYQSTSFLAKFNPNGGRVWATYFGVAPVSTDTAHNFANAVACDGNGNVYLAGNTYDTFIVATSGAYQTSKSSGEDGYIAKFSSGGTLVWATYYGGTGTDQISAMTCDASNNVCITGITTSSSFSSSGASQSSIGGATDAYVTKFNSSGARQWATYFGGSSNELGNAITCDTSGNVIITGQTDGSGTPTTTGCYQSSYGGGYHDAFIAKYNSSGALQWSTYYGGSGDDDAFGIGCIGSNQIYMTGATSSSSNIATSGSFQSSFPVSIVSSNGMLVKFNGSGGRVWGTYFGDSSYSTTATSLVCDTGNIFVGGGVRGAYGIATPDAYQVAFGGGTTTDGFLEQFNNSGSRLYGTYYGGADYDAVYGVATDKKGHVYICGATESNALNMLSSSYQSIYGGTCDAFLAKFTFVDTVVYFSVPFYETCERQGVAFNLPYQTTFPFHPGNVFTAQLSDSTGSFANPVNIGSITATSSGNISCTIPTSTPTAFNYRFRIVASSPADTSLMDAVNVTVMNPTISYTASICKGDSIKIYSSNTNTNILSRWTGPSGVNTTSNNLIIPNAQYVNSGIYRDTFYIGTCRMADSANITVNYTPAPLPTYNGPVCTTTALDLYANDTNSNATYTWTGPQSFSSSLKSPTISNTALADSGYYYVTATVGTCTRTDSVKVVVQQSVSNVTISGSDSVCLGSTLSLTAVTNTPNISYTWTGPNGYSSNTSGVSISTVATSNGGPYYLTISKAGCSNFYDTVNVYIKPTPSTPVVSNNGPMCVGATLNLNASSSTSNVTYSWAGPASFASSLQNTSRANMQLIDSGQYTLITRLNGCSSPTVIMQISVYPLPTYSHSFTSPCLGDSLRLNEYSGLTSNTYYWWGPGSFTSSVSNPVTYTTTGGKYYVNITSLHGCVAHDSMTVSVLPTPAVPTIGSNSPVCVGGTLSLSSNDVTSGVSYSWTGPNSFGAGGQNETITSVPAQDSGYYTVKARLSNGCYATNTTHVVLTSPPSIPVLNYDSVVCTGSTINILPSNTLNGGVYTWTSPGGSIYTGSNLVLNNTTTANTGNYTLTLQYIGCTVYDTAHITMHQSPAIPALSNNSPICAGNTLNITGTSTTGVTYSWSGPNSTAFSTLSFSIPNAPAADSGRYILSLSQNNCTVYDTINAAIKTLPTLSISTGNSSLCVGGGTIITASAAQGVTWTGPNGFVSSLSNPILSNVVLADSGIYIATTSLNGCSVTDSVLLQVHNPPAHPTLVSNSPVCTGDTIKITGINSLYNTTYNWTGAGGYQATNQNVIIPNSTISNAGKYYLQTNNGCIVYDTVTIIVRPIPVINGASSNSPICIGSQLSLTAGLVNPGTFSYWSGPNGFSSTNANPVISNAVSTDSGNYIIHAVYQGCTSTATVHVSVYAPNISYITNSPVCAGDTIKITNTVNAPGATYNWSGPNGYLASSQNIIIPNSSSSNAGAYYLQTNNGCNAYDTINVVIKPLPVINGAGSNSPVCTGMQLSLQNGTISPGTFSYWSGPNGYNTTVANPTISNIILADSGNYVIHAVSQGCTASYPVYVSIFAPNISYITNSPVCEGDTLKLKGNSTTPGVTYNWVTPANSALAQQDVIIPGATSANSGTYIFEVNDNGCIIYDTINTVVTPTPATPAISANTPVCSGATLYLSATSSTAGVSYKWIYPNGGTSTQQSPVINNVSNVYSGTYTLATTLNGCLSPATTATVTVNPTPTGTVTTNSPVCVGNDINFTTTATSGASFSWTGPNGFASYFQNPIVTNATTADGGTYNVQLLLNGCTNIIAVPVVISSGGTPAVSISVPNDTACKGFNVIFTATPTNGGTAPTYAWRVNGVGTGNTGPVYNTSNLHDGDIVSCIMQSNANCQIVHTATSNSIEMVVQALHPPPITVTVSPSVFTPGILETFTALTTGSGNCLTYQWKKNGVNIPGANTSSYQSATLTRGDKITLFVHSYCICTSPDTLLTSPISLEVNNLTAKNDYSIFPNPAQNEITIEGTGNMAMTELYDMGGKKLMEKQLQFNNGRATIHFTLPAGVYTLHLTDDRGIIYTERLVVTSE